MNTSDIQPDDTLIITGTTTENLKLVNFKCVVATRSGDAIKVWHHDENEPQLTEKQRFIGKFWFYFKDIEKVELVHRELT